MIVTTELLKTVLRQELILSDRYLDSALTYALNSGVESIQLFLSERAELSESGMRRLGKSDFDSVKLSLLSREDLPSELLSELIAGLSAPKLVKFLKENTSLAVEIQILERLRSRYSKTLALSLLDSLDLGVRHDALILLARYRKALTSSQQADFDFAVKDAIEGPYGDLLVATLDEFPFYCIEASFLKLERENQKKLWVSLGDDCLTEDRRDTHVGRAYMSRLEKIMLKDVDLVRDVVGGLSACDPELSLVRVLVCEESVLSSAEIKILELMKSADVDSVRDALADEGLNRQSVCALLLNKHVGEAEAAELLNSIDSLHPALWKFVLDARAGSSFVEAAIRKSPSSTAELAFEFNHLGVLERLDVLIEATLDRALERNARLTTILGGGHVSARFGFEGLVELGARREVPFELFMAKIPWAIFNLLIHEEKRALSGKDPENHPSLVLKRFIEAQETYLTNTGSWEAFWVLANGFTGTALELLEAARILGTDEP